MTAITRLGAALAGFLLCTAAHAVTGSGSITAGNLGGAAAGYCKTLCTPQVGSNTNPTLSDGKVLVVLLDASSSSGVIGISITGFAADPGKAYFNNLNLGLCNNPPYSYTSAVSSYTYYGGGRAGWSWPRSALFPCFTVTGVYGWSIN